MKLLVTLFFAIGAISLGNAQTFTVKGKILEYGKQDAIPYANVLLMTVSDSSQVSGTISELDGEFELSGIRDGEYLFKIQYLGYQDYFKLVKVSSNIDLGSISLREEATALGEVVVAARRATGT